MFLVFIYKLLTYLAKDVVTILCNDTIQQNVTKTYQTKFKNFFQNKTGACVAAVPTNR